MRWFSVLAKWSDAGRNALGHQRRPDGDLQTSSPEPDSPSEAYHGGTQKKKKKCWWQTVPDGGWWVIRVWGRLAQDCYLSEADSQTEELGCQQEPVHTVACWGPSSLRAIMAQSSANKDFHDGVLVAVVVERSKADPASQERMHISHFQGPFLHGKKTQAKEILKLARSESSVSIQRVSGGTRQPQPPSPSPTCSVIIVEGLAHLADRVHTHLHAGGVAGIWFGLDPLRDG